MAAERAARSGTGSGIAYQDDGLWSAAIAFQGGVGVRRDLRPLRVIEISCGPCRWDISS